MTAEISNTMTPVVAVQRRTTKNARSSSRLVDTVKEVVQAFEFEYAQAKEEAEHLKALVDDRRAQLSDLRKHLEKESGENGTLEAVIQYRNTKNDQGDSRLAILERDFNQIVSTEQAIGNSAVAIEENLVVFTQDSRHLQERTSSITNELDRAEMMIQRKEREMEATARDCERLGDEISKGRSTVQEREGMLRKKREETLTSRASSKEAQDELKTLEEETCKLKEELTKKEFECQHASRELDEATRAASEVRGKSAIRVLRARPANITSTGVVATRYLILCGCTPNLRDCGLAMIIHVPCQQNRRGAQSVWSA